VKLTVILICALFAITSCSDVKRNEQLTTIDTMVGTIDSLATVLKKNPASNSRVMSDSIKAMENRFKQYYISDTIDRVLANEVNDLKQARKTLSHLEKDHANFSKGCIELKENLRQLRYDIDNGDGDRKKYVEYIAFEESKLRDLNTLTSDHIDQKELSFDRYNRLYEKWNTFSFAQMKKNAKKVLGK
jgi:hypothetical protein